MDYSKYMDYSIEEIVVHVYIYTYIVHIFKKQRGVSYVIKPHPLSVAWDRFYVDVDHLVQA